jgi:hypothetical protein
MQSSLKIWNLAPRWSGPSNLFQRLDTHLLDHGAALNETTPKELAIIPVSTKLKNPFKAGSDLSKFGKQQIYDI